MRTDLIVLLASVVVLLASCSVCGDGVVDGDEICDDGPLNGGPSQCNNSCSGTVPATCGNSILESGEDCDDSANGDNCDECLDDCTTHVNTCGDGYRCGTEDCDDGNTLDGDWCSSLCQPNEPPTCDDDPPYALHVPAGLVLQSNFADLVDFEVRTSGIWAIWWHKQFNHEADADWLFDQLDDVRCRSLRDLEMQDPPNPGAGSYYNVYIHHGVDDPLPNGWGNGQGTNSFGLPYLTLPHGGAQVDSRNVDHEGFHVFQYSANSPGFAYSGDSQWYIEASAEWYTTYSAAPNVFVDGAGAIEANPQLALWHSFGNEAPGDPTDWLFQVRQYAMVTYLYYLTEFAGIDADVITSGFYAATSNPPQQYHYDIGGGDLLRAYFADWAAHNAADFDYLLPEQVALGRLGVEIYGDPNNLHHYVAEYTDAGTNGLWTRPPSALKPRSWAYNVVRVTNTKAATYAFHLEGDPSGSAGAVSHFEGRVVVMTSEGAVYTDLTMADAFEGSASVSVGVDANLVYLVIASVPEHFSGNQTYGYEYKIDRQ